MTSYKIKTLEHIVPKFVTVD